MVIRTYFIEPTGSQRIKPLVAGNIVGITAEMQLDVGSDGAIEVGFAPGAQIIGDSYVGGVTLVKFFLNGTVPDLRRSMALKTPVYPTTEIWATVITGAISPLITIYVESPS